MVGMPIGEDANDEDEDDDTDAADDDDDDDDDDCATYFGKQLVDPSPISTSGDRPACTSPSTHPSVHAQSREAEYGANHLRPRAETGGERCVQSANVECVEKVCGACSEDSRVVHRCVQQKEPAYPFRQRRSIT